MPIKKTLDLDLNSPVFHPVDPTEAPVVRKELKTIQAQIPIDVAEAFQDQLKSEGKTIQVGLIEAMINYIRISKGNTPVLIKVVKEVN